MPLFHRKKKELIVTIHGFGTKTSREMEPLTKYLKSHGYESIRFDYFNPTDLQDTDYKEWVSRCEKQLLKAIETGREIILIGFSMGGVIASHLASIYPVKKLILVAPAFSYMNLSKIEKAARGVVMSSAASENSGSQMSSAQTKAFMSVVSNYRDAIGQVDVPVLFLHGTDDEIISPRSSRRAYQAVPSSKKRLVYIEGGKHRMLYDGVLEKTPFTLIRAMIEDELF